MTEYMTVDQIISASKADIDNKIEEGLFSGDQEMINDNGENFYSIISLYCQWAEDPGAAELKVWEMFEEEYPEWFKE